MSVKYEDRETRLHQPIPHDPHDTTIVDTEEHPQLNFHRRALAVQNLMVYGRGFPFDMIRRCAEEFDAQVARGTPPPSAPDMLRNRAPRYFERRTMALEAWLVEQGFITEADRLAIAAEASSGDAPRC
jgi:hypothetical protein